MNLIEQIPYLKQLPPLIQDIVLKLILFIVAVLVVIFLRRVLMWVIVGPLRRVAHRTKSEFDDLLIEELIGPMRVVATGLGISVTVTALEFGATVDAFANLLTRSLFIIAVFYAALKIVNIVAFTPGSVQRFTGLNIENRLLPFFRTILRIVIVILAFVVILQEWGFEVSSLIASLGIVGLAFSLAAQDTASNFFGFTAILGDSPFSVGDFIKTPDVEGTVEKVGARSTRVRRLDQALVTVPNSKLAGSAILNWTQLQRRRLEHHLILNYVTTLNQLRDALERLRVMLSGRENVDPTTVIVNFINFTDRGFEIIIICQILLADWSAYTAEKELINFEILNILDAVGAKIALPSYSIYVENHPSSADERTFTPVEESMSIGQQAQGSSERDDDDESIQQ